MTRPAVCVGRGRYLVAPNGASRDPPLSGERPWHQLNKLPIVTRRRPQACSIRRSQISADLSFSGRWVTVGGTG